MGTHFRRARLWALFGMSVFLLASLPADAWAKGFSGRGGGRSAGFGGAGRLGMGKSFSFSGSGARRSSLPKPSYDRLAGMARQREISAEKFSLWKRSRGYEEPRSFDPGLSNTRQDRFNREVGMRQPTGYYRETPNVVIYRDSYDNGFLKYATMFWLFNHWNTIDRSRFDDQRIRALETQFRDLEAKGYKRDPNYVDPGVDPDLPYRREVAYGGHGASLGKIFWAILAISFLAWATWFIFIRRIPYPQQRQEG